MRGELNWLLLRRPDARGAGSRGQRLPGPLSLHRRRRSRRCAAHHLAGLREAL